MKPDYATYERIHKAVDLINSGAVCNFPIGRTDICEGLYVNVMEYETKHHDTFEAHRKWIDIHYLLKGEECIEIAPIEEMEITEPYNPEKDCELGKAKGAQHIIRERQYCITMPQEAHSPGRCVDKPVKVKKAVFKVLL